MFHMGRRGTMTDDLLPELQGYPLSLDTDQLCEVLNLDRQTALKLLNNGGLPGFKVGRQWRSWRSEVQAVIQGTWVPPEGTDTDTT